MWDSLQVTSRYSRCLKYEASTSSPVARIACLPRRASYGERTRGGIVVDTPSVFSRSGTSGTSAGALGDGKRGRRCVCDRPLV